MIILTIRTDRPDAELGLFDGLTSLAQHVWPAHRQLAETIHSEISHILQAQGKILQQVEGIVAYQGPGSFTGLRIGLSVANALAYSLQIPIVAAGGDDWKQTGIERLIQGENDKAALPEYGSEPHITAQKK